MYDSFDSPEYDDKMLKTPFSQENISALMNSAKPYINVIKRYWTDEEVSLQFINYMQDEKLRKLVD